MKSGFLSVLFLFLLIGNVFSQDNFISLSGEIISKHCDFYNVVNVINVTGEDDCVGFLLKGSFPEPLFFKNGFDTEIKTLLQKQYYEKPGPVHLIVRINRLFYYECNLNGLGNRDRFVDLNCTFIISDSTGYFDVFTGACSRKAKDQFVSSSKVIANAFAEVFDQFHERNQNGLLRKVEIDEGQLEYNPLNDKSHSENQLSNISSVRSVFKTYYDFRDNTPDTSFGFRIEYKDKRTELSDIMLHRAIPYTLDDEKIKNIWGFTDGEKVYWFVNDSYYLLEEDDYGLFASIAGNQMKYAPVVGASAGAYAGGVSNGYSGSMIGAVGGALAGALFSAASADLVKVYLNSTTGTHDLFLSQSQKRVKSTILFYASEYNKTETGIKLSFNGDYYCTLLPDTWTVVDFPSDVDTVVATFSTNSEKESSIKIIPALFKTDYYFCLEKKKKPIRITKADFDKREFINRSLSDKNLVKPVGLSD